MIVHAFLLRLVAAQTDLCEGLCTSDNTGLPKVEASKSQFTTAIQIIFAVIGVVALVNIILAGLRLATSIGSDPQAFSKARNTLIFAGIGLAVALSAELFVTFVLNRL